jgi:hypothetical protein
MVIGPLCTLQTVMGNGVDQKPLACVAQWRKGCKRQFCSPSSVVVILNTCERYSGWALNKLDHQLSLLQPYMCEVHGISSMSHLNTIQTRNKQLMNTFHFAYHTLIIPVGTPFVSLFYNTYSACVRLALLYSCVCYHARPVCLRLGLQTVSVLICSSPAICPIVLFYIYKQASPQDNIHVYG